MDFVIHFGDTIAAFSQQHSQWLLPLFFVLIFCETGLVLTPFLPGSTLLLIAGGFAARGDFALYEIVGLLAVAATLGDSMGFFFGRLLGLNSRFIKPAYLAKANAFQARFGVKAYALARFVPIARGLVPFIAGANGVPYRVFLPPNAAGVVLCVTSFCAAGYFSAELQQVPPFAWAALAIIMGVGAGFFVWRRLRRSSITKIPDNAPDSAAPAESPRSEHEHTD